MTMSLPQTKARNTLEKSKKFHQWKSVLGNLTKSWESELLPARCQYG